MNARQTRTSFESRDAKACSDGLSLEVVPEDLPIYLASLSELSTKTLAAYIYAMVLATCSLL